ncbi:MAG: HEAT repeat domain-containing protein [Planctomycetaceae bacterium]
MFCCCSGVLWCLSARGDEPGDVQGLISDLQSSDLQIRRDAAYALAALGSQPVQAVPALTKALEDRDEQVWMQSAMSLARIGPAAATSVPALAESLNQRDDQKRYRAAWVIGQIGPDALPFLKPLAESQDQRLRAGVAEALGWMSADGDVVLPELQRLLDDDSTEVVRLSLRSLGRFGTVAGDSVERLLSHNEPSVRATAAESLTAIGHASPDASNRVGELLEDQDSAVRAAAVAALPITDFDTERKSALVINALTDEDAVVRRNAILAIRRMETQLALVVAELTRRLTGSDREQQVAVLKGLAACGPESRSALPQLIPLLKDDDLRADVIRTIGRMGPTAVPDLFAAGDSSPATSDNLAAAIAAIGPTAIPEIIQALRTSSISAQTLAAISLSHIQPLPSDAFEPLVECLTTSHPSLQAAAASALRSCNRSDERLVAGLIRCAESSDGQVRAAGIGTLASLNVASEIITPLLTAALQDSVAEVRVHAIAAIQNRKGNAATVLPNIRQALRDDSPIVRAAAAAALGGMKADAMPVADDLLTLLTDADVQVQQASAQAIGDIGIATSESFRGLANLLNTDQPPLLVTTLTTLKSVSWPENSVNEEDQERILPLLRHSDPTVRIAAVRCFAAIQKDHQKSVPVLTDVLSDEDWTVRRAAGEALGAIGPAARIAVPQLFRLMANDLDSDYSRTALRAIDAAGPEALPVLLEGLKSDDRRRRYYAAFLIGKIGPEAQEAVPLLKEMIEQADSDRFRDSLRKTIQQLEADPSRSDES